MIRIAGSQRWLWQAAIVAFIAFEVVVAALGLELYFGWPLAALMVMGSLILRFGITFVIGAFLYAYFGWDWHWVPSMIFCAPALILSFPKLLTDFFEPQPQSQLK